MTHYDILCPTSEVVRNDFTNRVYLLPCVLNVQPEANDIYPKGCVKSQILYIGCDKEELPYISYNIFYCLIAECLKKPEWNNRAVKLYQSCAIFRIGAGINLIIDKLPSAIGLQLVYRHPNLQDISALEKLIERAKEIDPMNLIQSCLKKVIDKWMSYLVNIKMTVNVKCPYCRELLDIEKGLHADKSFLDCDNCSEI